MARSCCTSTFLQSSTTQRCLTREQHLVEWRKGWLIDLQTDHGTYIVSSVKSLAMKNGIVIYIYITCCINLNHWKVGQCQQMARRLKPGWFGYRTSRSPLRWDSSRQPKSSHQHLQRIAWILGDPVKVIGILFWGALVGFVCLKIDTIHDPQENRQVHSTQLVF